MELNNKFGTCCKCPGLLSDGRIFSSYVPRKDLNNLMMTELNAKDSNNYREILQQHGEEIATSITESLEKKYKCENTSDNKFYLEGKINDFFEKNLKDSLNEVTEISSFYLTIKN